MFENLLYQERFKTQILQEIKNSTLPSCMLIHGPSKSGKLTAALELARSLSCRKTGAWSCDCPSCGLHRTLDYPYLLLTGIKSLMPEVLAGAQLFEKTPTEPRRFFFLRAVKKITKRFDSVLWEGEEAKLKNAQGPLGIIGEELELYSHPKSLPVGDPLTKSLGKIIDACRTLESILPGTGTPINTIRRVSFWARTTSPEALKFVVIENADRMLEGARNSLLKILEEPPEGVFFMLLTSQKGAMLPTVLSRLRPLALHERTREQQLNILTSLFEQKDRSWEDLEDFFQAYETQKEGTFGNLVKEFLENLDHPVFPLESAGKFWSEGENFRTFLEELALELHKGLRGEGPSVTLTLGARENLLRKAQEAITRRETLNMSAPLLAETFFYQCRGVR